MKTLAIAGLALLAVPALAQTADLSIPLPKEAVVAFEVDARDDDLLATLRSFMSGKGMPMIPGMPGEAAGFIGVVMGDTLPKILKNVRRLHAVSFKAPTEFDALSFYEGPMRETGAQRMLYTGGKSPVLVLRSDGGIAFITRSGANVTVARTEGMPDMAALGAAAKQMFGMAMGMGMGEAIAMPTPAKPPKLPKPAKPPKLTRPAKPPKRG